MDTNPEDITAWLARETGHVPVSDEGYGDEEEKAPRKFGLPQDKHEKLRRFFDGLTVEKGLAERRRAESLNAIDETDEMNKALQQSIQPQTPPTGGAY